MQLFFLATVGKVMMLCNISIAILEQCTFLYYTIHDNLLTTSTQNKTRDPVPNVYFICGDKFYDITSE